MFFFSFRFLFDCLSSQYHIEDANFTSQNQYDYFIYSHYVVPESIHTLPPPPQKDIGNSKGGGGGGGKS